MSDVFIAGGYAELVEATGMEVIGDELVGISRRHVAGVSKRKSHGWSLSDGVDEDDSCEVNDVRKSKAEI